MSSNIQKFKNLHFGQNSEVHYFRLGFWVAPCLGKCLGCTRGFWLSCARGRCLEPLPPCTKKRPHLMECWDMSTRCFALLSLMNLEIKDECSKNDFYFGGIPSLRNWTFFFYVFFFRFHPPQRFLFQSLKFVVSIRSYDILWHDQIPKNWECRRSIRPRSNVVFWEVYPKRLVRRCLKVCFWFKRMRLITYN